MTKCNEFLQDGGMGQIKKVPADCAFWGGGVIVAVMFLAVFVGGANAGGPCSKSAEATSVETHHKPNEKAEVEA